jgi:4-amino-4-deoxy-L-arabinose transferase-like glycosyltransferase
MSETKSSGQAPASAAVRPTARTSAPVPFAMARKGLVALAVAFVAGNVVMMMSGAAGASSSTVTAVLWGGAALSFLGAFVLYMMEPASRRDGASPPADPPQAAHREQERSSPVDPSRSEAPAVPKKEPTGNVSTVKELSSMPPTKKSPDAPEGPAADPAAAADVKEGTSPSAPEAEAPGTVKSLNEEKPAAPLMPRGNPLRVIRGGLTTVLSSFFTLLLMGHAGQLRWGVPLGTLLVGIATWGVMDVLGTFDDPDERVARSTSLRQLAPAIVTFLGTGLLFCLALGCAQAGWALPQVAWGVVVTLAFVANVAAFFDLGRKLGPWRADEEGVERPLWKRHGFWVVVAAGALYFPFMGSYALWDPWETHYGEVAREMLARDDWISLWWAQDGWFWSKPVLDMWMQAIAMATLGVHYQPDKMLVGDGMSPVMHPEWAVRTPVVLLTIVAMYFLYKGVAMTYGRRAALLGSLVLATIPDWYFIAHQTMTDMPFVGAMTASIGLVLIGLKTPESLEARCYEVTVGKRRFRLSAWHLVFGTIIVCALPQILYLLSRNVEFLWRPGAYGFRPHWDEFRSGSGGGNCGLPGNEECRSTLPASIPHSTGATPEAFGAIVWRTVGAFEPALQALLWAVLLGLLLYMNWGERRVRRLVYIAAWFFAAISTLGKGPAGFGLPVLVTLAYLAAARPTEDVFARIQRVIREVIQMEIVGGILIIGVVALPWYIAMYVRHGPPFTDRLIFHDMFNRAFHHVHDTNEGDDTSFRFYVWQLGYALFPWTGLAPLGLLWWLKRGSSRQDNDRADTSILLCMWFVFGFALFSFMGTKFHHYIFPAVPPIAMLIGVVLDEMLGPGDVVAPRKLAPYAGALALGLTLMVFGVTRTQPGSFFGSKPGGHLPDASLAVGIVLAVVGLAVVGAAVYWFRSRPSAASPAPDAEPVVEGEGASHASTMLAAAAAAGALVLVLVTRDLALKEASDQPGAIRLLQLFTYNYKRGWPTEALDFSAPLMGFGAIAIVLSFALAVRAVRRHAVIAMCTFAFVWGLWGLDVYMTKTAPHWGQHEVIEAYYANRASPDEVLVAYQMNWKGENFYTGNHVPAFVSTGQTFTNWMKKKREEGAKVMFFITEHGRIGGLKSEVAAKSYREITDKTLCNKFVLVRAEL